MAFLLIVSVAQLQKLRSKKNCLYAKFALHYAKVCLSDPIKIVSTTSLQPKFIAKNLPTNAQLLQLPNSYVTTASTGENHTTRFCHYR